LPTPADPLSPWQLIGFIERLDTWIDVERPADDLRLIVTAWVIGRVDDPYQGVRRERGFPNLWFGTIPNTTHGTGQVVVCSYWIEETTRSVRCDSIATLDWPA
jgi:hypothetical protein